jgi:TolC family type I secretion outer membrane protein
MIAAARGRALRLLAAGVLWGASAGAQAMTLAQAFEAALERDPTTAVFQAQYEADRESGVIERAALRPNVDLLGSAGYARTESTGVFGASKDDYPLWSATAQVRQALFRLDWFDVGDRAKAYDTRAEIALRNARLELQRRVAERYFGVLVAQDQLGQAEAEERAVRKSLEDTRRRYEVELVPGTDLKEAQAREDQAQAQLLSARRALDNARDELEETTGSAGVVLPSLPPSVAFPPLLPADAAQWVEAARASSPRVAAAQQTALIARADAASRRALAFPTLDLVGSVGHDDTSDYVFGQKNDDARIGVELTVPLYAGGATAAALRQTEALQRVAEADLARIRLETERETRQLYRTVETSYQEVAAFEKSLASAEAAEVATRNGYDAGTRTIVDVLDAARDVVQARRDLNTTRYNLLLGLLQLKQTVGRLAEQDFVEIDRLLQPSASTN